MERELYVPIAVHYRKMYGYHVLIEPNFGDLSPDIVLYDDLGRIRLIIEVKLYHIDYKQIERYAELSKGAKVVVVAPQRVLAKHPFISATPLESILITA